MSANIYQSFLMGKIPKEEMGKFWFMIEKYEQIDLPKMIEGKFFRGAKQYIKVFPT